MANQKIIPFSVETKDVVFVKPSKPTPSTVLSLSTFDNNPELNILCQTIYVFKPNPNHGQPEPDPSCVIKEALSKVLFFYYPLAGKLKSHSDGKLRVNCDASGVPFLEATANCELSSLHYVDFDDGIDVIETTKNLIFNYASEDENSGHHPLVLQVTKFLCGGFTLGMGLSHSVCDGFGASQFFRAMAELASGKDEPSVKPVWERERLVGTILKEPIKFPFELTSSAASPFWPSSQLSYQFFNVKGAYVWRARARAMKLNSEGETLFCLTIGARRILDPPLPDGYYGNAFVGANLVLKVKELEERPLYEVVKLIKQSKKAALNNDYIRNSINMMETMRETNVGIGKTGSSTVLTDWRQLGLLEEMDFGWKSPVNIVPSPRNMFGYVDLCLFLPPSNLDAEMKGGVRVYLSLPEAAMPMFREEMEKLEHIGEDDGGI
ncbi:spermidine coumaroyl-CoA acyltransferase-like [Senna tora]|uniref:Spermidine coumaroyl-CoA acyltransferase-like n=1 Tax=Senna tora TaxID=362788 RepID=A0A834T8S4_9FABA|nr:spermidine coumaroyl-CoA acyltransferase-like [Senna tora]